MSLIDFETDSLTERGYRMPAEWEPHQATWLSWPKKPASWPGKFEIIPPVWAAMARELAEGETVNILVNDHEMAAFAKHVLKEHKADASSVKLIEIKTDDSWIRDFGPIFVKAKDPLHPLIALDWGYNAWGDKYPPYKLDNAVPPKIADLLKIPVVSPGMILEGGSIDVNGAGILLTTEQCLLNKNRNPKLSKEEIEDRIKKHLGIKKIIWLGDGIEGDDTDGHIDDLTRFVNENTILTIMESDKNDVNYEALRENRERLNDIRNLNNRPFEIVELPSPDPVVYEDARLPASYANFYIGNGAVLVPTYDCKRKDEQAVGIIREFFPDRIVVGIRAVDLVWGLGAFHCVTQQQPTRD